MDACPAHLELSVLQNIARQNIIMIAIPGHLTWLLQPLDVFVFRGFKEQYAHNMHAEKIRQPSGKLPHVAWWRCLHETIVSQLVRKSWGFTFARLGYLKDPAHCLTNHCQTFLADEATVTNRFLTAEEIDTVFGRHRVNIRDLCFSTIRRLGEGTLPALPAYAAPAVADDSEIEE